MDGLHGGCSVLYCALLVLRTALGMLFSHGGQSRGKTGLIVNTKASDGIQRKRMS
jgi:hypothetical protein